MSEKIDALIEEFNNQIRIAPRLDKERAGLPRVSAEEPRGETPTSYGGLRVVPKRGSRRAQQ